MDLSAYQSQDTESLFGGNSEVSELLKAMQAGAITGRETVNQSLSYEPLKLESLDKTLKLLEFRMKDVKLWNAVPKITAYNTVEEFVQLESYGTFTGGFYGEGETPDVQDSRYKRRAAQMKYIQIAGEVTLQAQLVKAVVETMQQEINNKTMWVIRAASHYMTRGNSALIPKEFDGIYAQHASIGSGSGDLYTTLDNYYNSTSVIDLRGGSLKQQHLVDAATNVNSVYGNVDELFAPPTVLDGLAKDYFDRQRILMGGGYKGTPGVTPKSIDTQFGEISLNSDVFMNKELPKTMASAASSAKAPTKPVAVSQTLTAADSSSKFAAGEAHTGALGTVFYAVTALNEYGESALTVLDNTNKITTAAGLSVDIKFTDGGGVFAATAYRIYRTKVTTATNATTGAVSFYPLFEISTAQLAAGYDGASATFVRDRNRILPDTQSCFVHEKGEDSLAFYNLLPISKYDLAKTGPATRFMVLLFGSPRLSQPKKMVKITNVGPYVFA